MFLRASLRFFTIEMLNRLEDFHVRTGHAHGSLQLSSINYLADSEDFGGSILTKFKFAKKYVEYKRTISAKILSAKTNNQRIYHMKVLAYNPYFASINCHNGRGGNRMDDLESLFYVVLYFYIGNLPWLISGLPVISEIEATK